MCATPGRPLDISDSPSLHLLIPEEEHMCIVLRVTPEQYLMVKNVMLEKYAERGPFTKSQLRKWVRMDVTKVLELSFNSQMNATDVFCTSWARCTILWPTWAG